ncbi:MAG TPA: transcriptional regulator [Colwellia sp.]|nr:transcriptional regulator [Colwellia sp.]|tara:strand:+ start:298 stop:513 length:216 start_codon:yes stop_codon:yes gene_type:complete
MSTRLVRLNEVITKTGLSRNRIYQYINEGRFPANVSLGGRSVAWVESEIEKWIENTIGQRDSNRLYGYSDY